MKNAPFLLFLKICAALLFIPACDFFGGKDGCDSAVCPENDIINIEYKSVSDSTTGLFGPGLFTLNQLTVTPILHDISGPTPFILKANLGLSAKPTVQVTAIENLRGITLQLVNFEPDTILLTTGVSLPIECCPEPPVTISQLLANGQLIPSIGSIILVDFYK